MPIETKNLVLYESERLTDNDDGGGKYNGQIIIDGQSNNLFDDVSELDRTMGDVSMRKIFPAVTTNDTDKLMGATVFISENPKDHNVSALLFSTKNWTDERQSAQNRVENYLAKGGQIAGTPLDTHWLGMKQLQVAMFPQETESSVGDTIVLVSDEGKTLEHEQYLRITKVETRTAIMVVDGKNVEYKIATYMLNDPLGMDFVGLSARQWYSGQASKTIIRDSIVADTGSYYASTGLAKDANVGEFTVNAESIFSQIIPSAQTESPIVDVNAAGESTILVPGNDGLITASFPTTVAVSQNLYIGSSVMPSSVAFSLFGQPVTDQGGLLKTSSGTQVGTIDYQRGLIQWTSSATTGATTIVITFKPAAAPNQYFQSYAMPVTQNNQSTNWTGVLVPIPAPGSLSISYMSQGKFYELKDDGSGQLKGASASFGSGRINYETGSWLLTTGALPDVDTPILLLWGTPIVTFVRSNLSVEKAAFEFDLGRGGIAPGVTINWLLEGVAKTAVSNAQGKFTGDATGEINYSQGSGKITPNKIPSKGTQFTVIYNYGNQLTQTKSAVAPDSNQKLSFTIGTGAAIQPNSVELSIPVSDALNQKIGTAKVIDVPINSTMGNLVSSTGDIQGTINYNTGAVEVTPILTSKQFKQVYTPTTVFGTAYIGIISASKAYELPNHIAGQTYSLADQRISWCELEDSAGAKVPFDMYVVDYDYGKFTLNGDFALGVLVPPLKAKYRYQDMGLIRDVQINGQITFTKPVTHNYSADESIVGSALVVGDMQARYTRKFVQPTWSNAWADEAIGGSISANYNDSLYPILTTNNGAIQERWALVFTGDGTNFRCVGEYSGQIGQGNVNSDFFPINPVTGKPYFTVKKEGWGAGWASGNVLRFNTIAATYPIWVIRTVKQSEPTVLSDQFQIMLRGDIDRVV